MNHFEPLTLLSAIAAVTTTHRRDRHRLDGVQRTLQPGPAVRLARRHLSHGRAGWNIVTSAGDDLARNYGFDEQAAHEDRYRGAEEFVEVVTRLWDSWDDDAVVVDKEGGVFIEDTRVHPIDHRGDRFAVAGPLDVPRSPQGHPVRVQAGSSPRGRDFAARHAEAIFTAQLTLAGAQEFYGDIRERVASHGRDPDRVKVLPGLVPIVGETEGEALAVHERLERHASMTSGLSMLSFVFGVDMSGLDLDGPLPPVERGARRATRAASSWSSTCPPARGPHRAPSSSSGWRGGRGHRVFAGDRDTRSPTRSRESSELGAADGFNVMPPTLPGGLDDFVDLVVPELQRRGLFRTDYTGETLRDHYGLGGPTRA